MSLVSLKRLLSKKSNASAIVNAYVWSLGITSCIQDVEGNVLFGEVEKGAPQAEIKLGDEVLGWVMGTHAELVALGGRYAASWRLQMREQTREAGHDGTGAHASPAEGMT